MNRIFSCFIVSIFVYSSSFAQTDPCDIKYKDGKSVIKTSMIGIHENLLLISDVGSYKIVNVEKIAQIKFDYGKHWKTGAIAGAVTGFIGGLAAYNVWGRSRLKFLPKDATLGIFLIFTIPSAIIGGLIGMAFKNIDVYELAKLNPFVKSKEIKFIMRDHATFK
ncbi:MAG: hypothetical protein L0Y79_11920 [Chlorobi bacterium]|nr:hypothetical protein [Chlorobiota bacterium]MCI0716120.1 hypothetical protein [Chlorobiota bacterium]